MRASDVSCDVVFGLIGRWMDGEMTERDRDAYEQHLLFCPPCLAQNDKARLALAALREATTAAPGDDIRRRLAQLVQAKS
jgi:hypothetical protein